MPHSVPVYGQLIVPCGQRSVIYVTSTPFAAYVIYLKLGALGVNTA
jgi:hypothetical protein